MSRDRIRTVGFIGLGVMGEPICRNLARKLGDTGAERLLVHDLSPDPVERLVAEGAQRAPDLQALVRVADLVLMSLPGEPEVEAVVLGDGGLAEAVRPGTIVVDLSTTPVGLTRSLAARLKRSDVDLVDAPVARTRAAAEAGTLAIMLGGEPAALDAVVPFLATAATDIARCGGSGCGQMVKILNNMVLFETVHALAEALAIARRGGLDGTILFEALANGSADSFALRNHGMKAVLPGDFPRRAFSVAYAAKDLDYALDLAEAAGVPAPGAEAVRDAFRRAAAAGFADDYWPVISQVVGGPAPGASNG